MRYACSFRAPDGGTREVVVELSKDEIADCLRQVRDGQGSGVPNGPLPRAFAWRRAVQIAPELELLFPEIRLVH
jgi:hypothetical protein